MKLGHDTIPEDSITMQAGDQTLEIIGGEGIFLNGARVCSEQEKTIAEITREAIPQSVKIIDSLKCFTDNDYWNTHGTCPKCRDGSVPECVGGSFICKCGWRG